MNKKLLIALAWIFVAVLIVLGFVAFKVATEEPSQPTQPESPEATTAPTTPPTPTDPTEPEIVKELTLVVDADTISKLENYPDLEKVDLTGSTCYPQIVAYAANHPEVEVLYSVSVGVTKIANTETDITLNDGTYEYDKLVENLKYLPGLKSLHLKGTRLNAVQMDALRLANPQLALSCTIHLNGVELGEETTELNLSAITSEQVDVYIAKLALLPNLHRVELMTAEGKCNLSDADIKKLEEALPYVIFNHVYEFELFGQTLSTADTRVEFVKVDIGDEGEQEIRNALDRLVNCTYFLLDDCGLSNEVLAGIRDDYPHIKIVWRVFQTNKNRSWLTDTEVLRAVYGITDANSGPLKYLTDVKYMDLGHNTMVDISFCAYMPNLEIAILSGSSIKDLTPLGNCKKLEFLELAWCGHITDVSPLAGCESLKYLNISHTSIKNVETLKDLPLEMLSFVNSGNKVKMTEADWKEIQTLMPNCWITYAPLKDNNAFPYGVGWRYTKTPMGPSNFTACYKKVREVFEYDKIDQIIAGGNSAPTGNAAIMSLTKVVTAETISDLDNYPNLKDADLTGSTCYDAILSYMNTHPQVTVTFTVPLGGSTTVKNTTKELSVKADSYDLETLTGNLKYVTGLKNLTFLSTGLNAEQINALKTAYPGINFRFTMAAQSIVIDGTSNGVDLSAITSEQVDETIAQLNAHPNVVWVELMNSTGSSNLSIADVKKLQHSCPNVIFHYSFSLFDKTVSTTDARVEYVNKTIGNSGEEKIREALDILTGCTYFKLDNCGLSNEVLAQIRDDYPNTKVVWRIYQTNKNRSWLTDTEVLRAVYGVTDANSGPFKYLTEVKYMDLGHNTSMVDLSFCAYMPNLEIAILSGSPIKDLTPLGNCKKLEFLEVAWCGHLKDISPLAGCESLKYLNIGHTKVSDLSPLQNLQLQALSYVNSGNRVGFTVENWEYFQYMFPNCWITYSPLKNNEAYPYGVGWREKPTGGYTPIYRKVRDVFGYDNM